ncbi:E3 ubiquitin-protein ligase UHRF1-like [Venturia canescens]|uniref:E3 ubiquitin-protein ligase UHRF1-like n=1 Tax=Venturia canescens TaxID=32260 RepID=UPI001C9C2B93|nr:E3 ubiquitin-protein ligase UHRF1-like [Venturia canescens]
MYVKVKTVDGKQEVVLDVSKLTRIEELKFMVTLKWSIEENLQKLFYRGKLLEEGYKLFDYNINTNDVILLMVNNEMETDEESQSEESMDEDDMVKEKLTNNKNPDKVTSPFYKAGDKVDCQDKEYGGWFEAEIHGIHKKSGIIGYSVKWEFGEDEEPFDVEENIIRPRAYKLLSFEELKIGDKVMINHNIDQPNKNGFWYDFTILEIKRNTNPVELVGTIHIGNQQTVRNQKVSTWSEVYAIEKAKLLENRNDEEEKIMREGTPKRKRAVICENCNDDQHKNCKECGCKACGGKHDSHVLLLCDECNYAYHLQCLNPPLDALPNDAYWYCAGCKRDENEIVEAGDKKQTKKTMQSSGKTKEKNWENGMTCLGREEECTIVPSNHRGAVPGVEVGTSWLFRLGVSQAGVHRPRIGGIHGREKDCAYSIVLSGGYEDNIDDGDEFIYTGSGGRDLSGNKRTAEQSCDQTLTRMNKALALNCSAKLDSTLGAEAENWKDGIPVRVVRKYNRREHKYAPKIGYRYDGLYKVVKYFPETGKSGYSVWRYRLRRDDPSPAPWTDEGKERIAALGLELICPKGYEMDSVKEKKTRKCNELEEGDDDLGEKPAKKKFKRENYRLGKKIVKLMKLDAANTKLWDDCRSVVSGGKSAFLERVIYRFLCVSCQELVYRPITTPCGHNICKHCLKSRFKLGVYTCPACRHDLGDNQPDKVNEPLSEALLLLFPGTRTQDNSS